MDTWVWIVIAVVAVVILLGLVWAGTRTRRSRSLKDTFGREYDRTVEQAGDRRAAERELREREKQYEELELRPLSAEARDRFIARWEETQLHFVDDPQGAVAEADALVQEVMKERGFEADDFDRRVADISVAHPDLVEKYRTADGIARKSERGEASTDELRHSVRHYRALFAELLEVEDRSAVEAHGDRNVERLR